MNLAVMLLSCLKINIKYIKTIKDKISGAWQRIFRKCELSGLFRDGRWRISHLSI